MNLANVQPSTRSLLQTVSPNPGTQSRLIRVDLKFCTENPDCQMHLQTWEDEEIAGLIIRFLTRPLTQMPSIKPLKNTLQCPFLAQMPVTGPDDIVTLRALDFDAVVTPVTQASASTWRDWQDLAQSMNLALIYQVADASEWQIVAPLKPRFIFVEKNHEFLQEVPTNETWLIGPDNFENPAVLKCKMFTSPS